MDIKGIGKGALIAALGTAGGTLILTALSWAFGFHHAIWVWIVSVAIYPVPAWVLVPIGIFLGVVIVLWRAAESQISDGNARADTPTESAASVLSETAPLTENETTIVRLLARADGNLMSASELARRASLAKLVTDQTLDQLRARGFTKEIISWEGVRLYGLSPAGRDYAITKGYVPAAPTAAERRALR